MFGEMKACVCNRLYRMRTPTAITECAFSGSLCRIRKFETVDGSRYCLTVFSLGDYKQLHFPCDEYKYLTNKLCALLSAQAILPTTSETLSIKPPADNNDFKIKFGTHRLTIGSVTAFGLVKTNPFNFWTNKDLIACDSKWDICTCKKCPVFKRLVDYEMTSATRNSYRRVENVILFEN